MLQSILDSALKTGTTFAILKTFGNIPLKNDLLISSDNGPDKVSLASLRIFVGSWKFKKFCYWDLKIY